MRDAVEDREAVRFLRRLSSPKRSPSPADRKLTDVLAGRGLIARDGKGALAITESGRAFLRRKLSDPDAFAAQHQTRGTIVIDDGDLGRSRVTVNHDESPLAWMRRHKGRDGRPLIDAVEFAAGERLRADFTRGNMMPRVTANWTASVARGRRDGGAGGVAELTEAAIAARRRVANALDAVGPEFAGILVDFCCFLKSIEEIERSRLWPARSAKLVIRLALASLARHYGLSVSARGREASGRLRHWGAEDYRPTIE